MTQKFQFKAGSTFRAAFAFRGLDGQPLDLTGVEITSQIRMDTGPSRGWVADLAIEDVDISRGRFDVFAAAQATPRWPPGPAIWDIRLRSENGHVEYLPPRGTFIVQIEKAVTWAR